MVLKIDDFIIWSHCLLNKNHITFRQQSQKKTISGCFSIIYCSLFSRRRLTAERTDAAAMVEYTQAPPATTRLHLLHDQIPTQARFMESCEWKKKAKLPQLDFSGMIAMLMLLVLPLHNVTVSIETYLSTERACIL